MACLNMIFLGVWTTYVKARVGWWYITMGKTIDLCNDEKKTIRMIRYTQTKKKNVLLVKRLSSCIMFLNKVEIDLILQNGTLLICMIVAKRRKHQKQFKKMIVTFLRRDLMKNWQFQCCMTKHYRHKTFHQIIFMLKLYISSFWQILMLDYVWDCLIIIPATFSNFQEDQIWNFKKLNFEISKISSVGYCFSEWCK